MIPVKLIYFINKQKRPVKEEEKMLTSVDKYSTGALISSVRILAVFRETRVLAWTGRLNTRREWGALRPVFGGLETAPEQGSTGHGTFKPAKRLA